MKTKYFYNAFNILYDLVKESLGIFQKEELYRQLFQAIYVMSGDALYDNDSIRKITSGNQTIHLRAVKKLHTPEGFEKFRRDIERVCLTNINSPVDVANKLLEQCEQVSEEGSEEYDQFDQDTISDFQSSCGSFDFSKSCGLCFFQRETYGFKY